MCKNVQALACISLLGASGAVSVVFVRSSNHKIILVTGC